MGATGGDRTGGWAASTVDAPVDGEEGSSSRLHSAPMEPFALSPVLVERPWGGRRLSEFGKSLPGGVTIGESWEVADLPDGVAVGVDDPRSRVATGPHAGSSLGEVARRLPDDLFGPGAVVGDEFPLLVKLLDAREHLSVQVHPHARYAGDHPEVRLKTESWYVVDAEPEAVLFLDLRPDAERDQVVTAVGTPDIVDLLQRVPARAGDFHHLPAGLVHALGAGVMVAEIQTPSDTTFRMYDWSEEYRRAPRPLHVAEALETLVQAPEGFISTPGVDEPGSRLLVDTPHYRVTEHRSGDGAVVLRPQEPWLRVCVVVAGSALVGSLEAARGTTFVVPASAGAALEMSPGAVLLEVVVPQIGS